MCKIANALNREYYAGDFLFVVVVSTTAGIDVDQPKNSNDLGDRYRPAIVGVQNQGLSSKRHKGSLRVSSPSLDRM
jgi:hypothetical protein